MKLSIESPKIGKNLTIAGFISCLSLIAAYFCHQTTKTHHPNNAKSSIALAISLAVPIVEPIDSIYNVEIEPNFHSSPKLQTIVDEMVAITRQQGLPTEKLSITLIDVNSLQVAGYRERELRYPASVSKLFWMVSAFDLIERNRLAENKTLKTNIVKMIRDSDNEASNRILDLITNSESGANLNREQLQVWLQKRHRIDRFFQEAGYHNIKIAQKTYPIPYLHLEVPQGRDLQMRGSFQHPLRNQISTRHSGRLMYEIVAGLAVSPESSRNMMALLTIDAATRRDKIKSFNSDRFNSVLGFLSQSLPYEVDFASKAGWTSDSRQEVASIKTKDSRINYILAICGEDRAFADNWHFFPQLSLAIFQKMSLAELERVVKN